MSVLTPLCGHGGRLRCMWGTHVSLGHGGGGVAAHWGPPVISSMISERIQRSEKGDEAGSDPRGHLWVTSGVYLWAGKPPLADIILFHPPDLTRCDNVIGLAIPAMRGQIHYRGAAG